MASIENIIEDGLRECDYKLWVEAWDVTIDWVLAESVLANLDLDRCQMTLPLPKVNDPSWRALAIAHHGEVNLIEQCLGRLIASHNKHLNDRIVLETDTHGRLYDKRTRPQMETHLRRVVPQMLRLPRSDASIVSRRAVDVWRAVSHVLSKRIYQAKINDPSVSDSTLHDWLLLAAYFNACNLSNEEQLNSELKNFGRSLLGVQGRLVDIIQVVSQSGHHDVRPRFCFSPSNFSLRHQRLSPLLESLVGEVGKTEQGEGFLTRMIGSVKTGRPEHVDQAVLDTLRRAEVRKYELSVLAFMTLSSIEHLLRAFVCKLGLFDAHRKFDDKRIEQIGYRLGGTDAIKSALRAIYGASGCNLRNRVLHGAWLQIERTRLQDAIPLTAESEDPYSPVNTLRLCLDALSTIDEHVAETTSLTQHDLAWTSHFHLSGDELNLGNRITSDFHGADIAEYSDKLKAYLIAVMPSIRIIFTSGLIGWLGSREHNPFISFISLNMMLETFLRAAVRMVRGELLNARKSDGHVEFRYKMLNASELCGPDNLDKLLRHRRPSDRATGKNVLLSAVRVRDAVAHGAITELTKDCDFAMGHLIVKSIQWLVDACEHEMNCVAAYYRWIDNKSQPKDPVRDWLQGEQEIFGKIKMMLSPQSHPKT